MAFLIDLDEGTAARRRVPFKLFTSNGTSPDTGASGDSLMYSVNGGAQSDLTTSVISANAGMYYGEFAAADVGTLGTIALWHDIGSFVQHVANVNVVNFNPMSSQSNIPLVATVTDVTNQVTADMTAISGDATAANNLEAAFDGTGYDSALTVFVKDSIATIAGVTNIATDVAAVPTAVENRTEMDANSTELAKIGTIPALDAGAQTIGAAIAKLADDNAGATFDAGTDSLTAIRDRGDAAWTTGAGGSDRLLMVDTTIATLATQTSFTLTAGSTDDDAYNNCTIVIEDVSTAVQKAVGLISAYAGGTKTVTLKYDPGVFVMAATDKVYVLAENALKSSAFNRQLDVTATGAAGIDWGNIENQSTAVDLSATDFQLADTTTDVTNLVTANMTQISGDASAANNLEAAFNGTGYDSALTTFIKDSVATIAGVTNVSTEIAALNDIDGSNVTLHAGVHSSATIQGVELVDLTTANTDMVGTDGALQPTVAARTLDVTVGGTAGIDWANVEAPTTALDLSATTIRGADLLNSGTTIRDADYSAVTVRVDSSVTIAGVTNVSTEIAALNDIDGSEVTIHSGGILSTSYAAGARDAAGQAADLGAENADALLDRDMSTGADSGSSAVRTARDALRALRNRVDLSENTLTVFEEDDVTEAWRASLTTSGDSNFPTAMDPSG